MRKSALLAPVTTLTWLAVVTNVTPIDGTLISNGLVGGGEVLSYTFTGTLPSSSYLRNITNKVPKSPAPAQFGAGVVWLGLLLQSRNLSRAPLPALLVRGVKRGD